MREPLRAGEVAAAAGVNVETLRYYERRGILPEPDRSAGRHRRYPPAVVTVLRVIKAAQHLGFSLDEVADLLHAATHHRHRSGNTDGLKSRVAAKLVEVEAKIADLNIVRATLLEAVEAGCDDLIACASSSCCPIPFVELGTPARRRA